MLTRWFEEDGKRCQPRAQCCGESKDGQLQEGLSCLWSRDQQTFNGKGQMVNIGGSVASTHTQLCPCHAKAAREYVNEWAWLCSIKNLLTKIGSGLDLVPNNSFLTHGLNDWFQNHTHRFFFHLFKQSSGHYLHKFSINGVQVWLENMYFQRLIR